MMGVRKMIVVLEVLAKRRSGAEAERKRISSVIGPYIDCKDDPDPTLWIEETHCDIIPIPHPPANSGV